MKKFLVQIEDAPSTRWVGSDSEFCERLSVLASAIAESMTEGPEPRLTVIADERIVLTRCTKCGAYNSGPCACEKTLAKL